MSNNDNINKDAMQEEQNTEKKDNSVEEEVTEEMEQEKVENDSQSKESEEAPKEPQEDNDTRYLRLAADFQNYKRRTEKEKSDIYAYANEKIALDLLEVIDNFDRALMHGEESSDKKFVEGMMMIMKQLKGVLDKHNILEIPALGEEFDPNYHSAVMMEDSEEYDSGKITAVLLKGYTLNGKVIRPSTVKVAN